MNKVPKETVEEILENLIDVLEENEKATVNGLAERLDLTIDEMTDHLADLEDMGYLTVRDESIVPTKKGEKLGTKMVRKHRLLERFLYDVLGLRQENVHDEACKLEHALSDDAGDALCRFLEHPDTCPDDKKPIPACSTDAPDCELCGIQKGTLVPLTELKKDCKAKVRLIRGGKAAMRRLRDMGIIPNMPIVIRRKSPMGGPIELEVCGTKLALGRGIAEKVFVEVC